MSNPPWLDGLRVQLVRRGLPSRYAARFVRELAEHCEDVLSEEEEVMSKEALQQRMGETEDLAEMAVSQYRRRTFFGRHPVLTFLVAPVPLVLVGWALFLLTAMLLFQGAPFVLGDSFDVSSKPLAQWPPLMVSLAWGLHGAARFVPPALVAALFWWLAARSGLSWRWSLGACVLVGLIAAAYTSQMVLPIEPGKGQLSIGLGISLVPSGRQLAQLAVPAAIGLLSAWMLAHRDRSPASFSRPA